MADSVCILRIEPIGFSDRLHIWVRERWVEDGAMIFALSNWKIGNAINQVGDSQVSAQEDRDLKFYLQCLVQSYSIKTCQVNEWED